MYQKPEKNRIFHVGDKYYLEQDQLQNSHFRLLTTKRIFSNLNYRKNIFLRNQSLQNLLTGYISRLDLSKTHNLKLIKHILLLFFNIGSPA